MLGVLTNSPFNDDGLVVKTILVLTKAASEIRPGQPSFCLNGLLF